MSENSLVFHEDRTEILNFKLQILLKFFENIKAMRFLTFCSVLLFCIGAILTGNVNRDSKPNEKDTFLEEIESEYKDQWITWKKLYGKEYTDFNEEITKFSIWLNNLRFVIKHNLDASLNRSSFTTALNEYSDLSTYDIRKKMNGANVNVKQDLLTTSEKVFTKPENLVRKSDQGQLIPTAQNKVKGMLTFSILDLSQS